MIFNTVIFFLTGIFLCAYFYVNKKYSYLKVRNILHIKPKFPYGNLQGLGKKIHIGFVLKNIYDQFVGKDIFAGMFFFIKPVYVLLDPDFVKKVMVKDFNYFTDRGVYHNEKDDPISSHLFALEGSKWKSLRAKLTPTFTSGKMKMMFNTILTVSDEFKKFLQPIAESGSSVEIKDILARFTTDIIGTCAFGIDCNSIRDPNAEFRTMGRKAFDQPTIQQLLILFVSSFPKISRKLGLKFNDSKVSHFFLRIVKETIDYRETNNIKRNDFMELLLQLKNCENMEDQLTFHEIAAQCFIFFLAGFETSSTTMTYCLYELAKNIDIQEKARNEIKKVLAMHNGNITYESLLEMPYLDKIINETLRKYPPVVNLIRTAIKDYPVEERNCIIEKGSFVMIPVYGLHHDPKIYPDPDKFNPNRFDVENIKSRHPFTYLPFGDGPRICIGQRFGMMQTRVGLITLLMNYKLSPTDKTPEVINFLKSALILTAKDGVWLKFENI